MALFDQNDETNDEYNNSPQCFLTFQKDEESGVICGRGHIRKRAMSGGGHLLSDGSAEIILHPTIISGGATEEEHNSTPTSQEWVF